MAKRRWVAQVSIIVRMKDANGNWGFHTVKRGPKTKDCRFYLRFTDANGHQQRKSLPEGSTYEDAQRDRERQRTALDAALRGIVVPEAVQHNGRTTVQKAVDKYLQSKSGKKKKTVQKYRKDLEHFVESLPPRAQFVEDIDAAVLSNFQDITLKEGYSAKTLHNRFVTVAQMLADAGSTVRPNRKNAPDPEQDPPRAYSDAELRKLFSVMDEEEQVIFKFFRGTGCREQEVQHAEWSDIDWQHHTHTVRAKPKWGFTPKNHEARSIPLPAELVKLLKEHRKTADPDCTLIFPNTKCRPNGHFLRYLKSAAKRAGLNCGHCVEKLRNPLTDQTPRTCKTAPVCEEFKLHNFRKTYATKLHHHGTSLNDLKTWLGHKDLKTTQLYLAGSESQAPHVRAAVDAAFSF
jgi:integrase/recombinase XerD